jgi:hypothetical protein
MLILKKNNNPIFFIHIPRTGGRYLRELFIKNKFIVNFWKHNEYFYNKEIPHLNFPYYLKFSNNGIIPQFTIVRNPITRFISLLSSSIKKDNIKINIEEVLNDETLLFNFLNKQILETNFKTNWFLPQYFFINPKCKIWKYENGFNLNFFTWLKKEFKIKIENKKIIETNFKTDYDNYKKIKISKKTNFYLKKYYQLDYKIFNYK